MTDNEMVLMKALADAQARAEHAETVMGYWKDEADKLRAKLGEGEDVE